MIQKFKISVICVWFNILTTEQLGMGLEGLLQKAISTNKNNSLHRAPELAELTKCVKIPRKEKKKNPKNKVGYINVSN